MATVMLLKERSERCSQRGGKWKEGRQGHQGSWRPRLDLWILFSETGKKKDSSEQTSFQAILTPLEFASFYNSTCIDKS